MSHSAAHFIWVSVLSVFVSLFATATEFHVSTSGNDDWSGTSARPNRAKTDGPFATLDGARTAIGLLKSSKGLPKGEIRVTIHGGDYSLREAFKLGIDDSGTDESPIVYAAKKGDNVRLLGGQAVPNFEKVRDASILDRLDEGARGQVFVADLEALGIADFGSPVGGGLELFFDGQPMMLSRWPNEGFTRIVDTVVEDGHAIHGNKGSKVGKFKYEGDRAARWGQETDLWAHGYWFWDWSDQRQEIESIDTENSIITIAEPYHGYGYRKGQWYYVYNALAELDTPGEWYLDRDSRMLYFWPPKPIAECEAIISLTPNAIIMDNVSHITFERIAIEATRQTAIRVSEGTGNRIMGCTIQNIGTNAVSISGGSNHGVIGCDITRTGSGGISLSGGDRTTLEASGHFAENNHIHHYARTKRTYQSAVQLSGVGNRASHNLINDAPHMAIGFGGNDHLIEFNEIHSVSYESNDAGAIYTGRNWTMRGNIIRNNYLHHINGFEGKGCVGIYLDDMFASAEITGNVFYKVTRAAFIGGGRDCLVANNLFVDCEPALHVDARALGWAAYHADEWLEEQKTKGTISGIAYDKPPYSTRYPELPRILEGSPKAPEGNVIRNNVSWGGKWDGIYKEARPYLVLENNLIEVDPLIVDKETGDFRLRKDSPAFDLGFEAIP
ncbi:MAG TPA: hypothetical protein EYN96_11005, partial [Candidatus Hydrogenedentes bacterium]|nr:hypothetical protein [Candidatus Hydrogenedentota bacterium]